MELSKWVLRGSFAVQVRVGFFLIFLVVAGPVLAGPAPESPDSSGQPPAVSTFASLPEIRQPTLSRNGSKLLFLQPFGETYHASVLDLESRTRSVVLAADADEFLINWCRWANATRVVCSLRFYGEIRAGQIGTGVRRYRDGRTTFTRLFAVDIDGENQLQLIDPPTNRERGDLEWNAVDQDNVISWLTEDDKHILVQLNREDRERPSVYRLNIYNNRLKKLRRFHETVYAWYADNAGVVRFATGYRDTEPAAFRIDSKKRLIEIDLSPIASAIVPGIYGLSGDGKRVYFASYHDGGVRKLYEADAATGEILSPIVETDGYDFYGSIVSHPEQGHKLFAQYYSEVAEQVWFDQNVEAILAGALATLRGTHTNVNVVSADAQLRRFVLTGEGKGTAPTYYIYDHAKRELRLLVSTYGNLERVIDKEVVRYQTRDDYPVVAYLTRPEGEGPFPAVILPHGGPNSRDTPAFDYWTQFLVSRGYAVLQPNFRGSTGYGLSHLSSGFEQWGLRMQEDVVDGLDWLIARGIADPERVCFVGGSYGGYVSLVAAFKIPDRIRCAVSFAGVTDLAHLKAQFRLYDLGELSLARIQSGSAVNANSPMRQVEEIGVPLLIVHGDLDRNVMIEQSQKLVAELEKAGKPVVYIEQTGGDHHLSRQSHRTQFLEAVDEFLGSHLR